MSDDEKWTVYEESSKTYRKRADDWVSIAVEPEDAEWTSEEEANDLADAYRNINRHVRAVSKEELAAIRYWAGPRYVGIVEVEEDEKPYEDDRGYCKCGIDRKDCEYHG